LNICLSLSLTQSQAVAAHHGGATEGPLHSKFWLEFALFDDGLDARNAASLVHPTLSAFSRFSELPPELRLKIWSYLIQPRVLMACCFERSPTTLPARRAELDARSQHRRAREAAGGRGHASPPSPPVPVLLHVNQETRALALEHYELTFGWKISALLSDTPVERPPRVWFNFALDALYLTGEPEAYDSYGFNSPMVYFLRREDARRVRHIACPFRELHYPEQESDQIFGCLWHVVDRFYSVERLLLTVGPGDEEAIGGCTLLSPDNVIQKIWNGWICGTTVTTSSLANKQILMVREEDLPEFVASH
jgi:hypothetical protein